MGGSHRESPAAYRSWWRTRKPAPPWLQICNEARSCRPSTVSTSCIPTRRQRSTVPGRALPGSGRRDTRVHTARSAHLCPSKPSRCSPESTTSRPVQNVKAVATTAGTVGYIQFNDHLATADRSWSPRSTLCRRRVNDLVLDVRYNGGGYLDIASELAYMIAGAVTDGGKAFESLRFNDKHPSINPVTAAADARCRSTRRPRASPAPPGDPYRPESPPRVRADGPDTCSASESIINGLRGVDVQVI